MKNEKVILSFIFTPSKAQFPSQFVSRNPGGEDDARQAQRHQFDPIKNSTLAPLILGRLATIAPVSPVLMGAMIGSISNSLGHSPRISVHQLCLKISDAKLVFIATQKIFEHGPIDTKLSRH